MIKLKVVGFFYINLNYKYLAANVKATDDHIVVDTKFVISFNGHFYCGSSDIIM